MRNPFKNNIISRSIREKKAWDKYADSMLKLRPDMLPKPVRHSIFQVVLSNVRRFFNGGKDYIPRTRLGNFIFK
jgi:hypothetical protein